MGVKERSGGADFPLSPMIFKQVSFPLNFFPHFFFFLFLFFFFFFNFFLFFIFFFD